MRYRNPTYRNSFLLLMALLLAVPVFSQVEFSKVRVADNGDETCKNPIIHAGYSNPEEVRVGYNNYMTASSFYCVPGLPILHSNDLVNWSLIDSK
ncbi:family 43 glycosylhydrolase [Maribellus sediminis]|uniref:family 43 glycosylhydrolase n=1 Tax=Maribellus sediminis TaxID=2696285 RepID=UPI0019811799|nr:family 43 glycosylhydrolase [Maribellus sediminis]